MSICSGSAYIFVMISIATCDDEQMFLHDLSKMRKRRYLQPHSRAGNRRKSVKLGNDTSVRISLFHLLKGRHIANVYGGFHHVIERGTRMRKLVYADA